MYIKDKKMLVFNPVNAQLNPICHLPAFFFGAHHILHISRIMVNAIFELLWTGRDSSVNLIEVIPMCLIVSNVSNKLELKKLSVKHTNLLSRVATCFDLIGSSSGLYYEPVY